MTVKVLYDDASTFVPLGHNTVFLVLTFRGKKRFYVWVLHEILSVSLKVAFVPPPTLILCPENGFASKDIFGLTIISMCQNLPIDVVVIRAMYLGCDLFIQLL